MNEEQIIRRLSEAAPIAVGELAQMLRCSCRSIRTMADAGLFESVAYSGRVRRYTVTSVRAFLRDRKILTT